MKFSLRLHGRRILAPCFGLCAVLAAAPARAQTASSTAAPDNRAEVVQMSKFEVVTTQGHGYVSTSATEAMKSTDALLDIPQADIVVTQDLIRDLAQENSSDLLQYVGVATGFEGENLKLRGVGAGYPLVDEMPDNSVKSDPAVFDTIEVVKGPLQALYMLSSSLGGIVIKETKKPLPVAQNILTASVDEYGLYRVTLDSTGPLGKLAGFDVSYRVVLVNQGGDTYFSNIKDNRNVVFPVLQFRHADTTVRISFDGQYFQTYNGGMDLITPTGQLWTGAGRKASGQPPGNTQSLPQVTWQATVLQKLSDNWEMRLTGQYYRADLFGSQDIATADEWVTNPGYVFYQDRYDDQRWIFWTVENDYSGHYDIGPSNWEMKNEDNIGWGYLAEIADKYVNSNSSFPFSNTAQGLPLLPSQTSTTYAVPNNSEAAVNAMPLAPLASFSLPATGGGSHVETYEFGVGIQHSMEVIPNWLQLIGGVTYCDIQTETVTNIAALPWTPVRQDYQKNVDRLGAVLHLTRMVSVYALDADSFSPAAAGDYLENGTLPPPSVGLDHELGIKVALLGGRLTAESAWFHMTTNNPIVTAGTFPNGNKFYAVIPNDTVVEEGVDGDMSFEILPGWQIIGSFYAGHDRDINNTPQNGSYDNLWSAYTRYEFPKDSALHGFSVGLGNARIGGRWYTTSGIDAPAGTLPANGVIKLQTGNSVNGFVGYQLNHHWRFLLNATNLLNEAYPLGIQGTTLVDPSPPLTFRFETDYQF